MKRSQISLVTSVDLGSYFLDNQKKVPEAILSSQGRLGNHESAPHALKATEGFQSCSRVFSLSMRVKVRHFCYGDLLKFQYE